MSKMGKSDGDQKSRMSREKFTKEGRESSKSDLKKLKEEKKKERKVSTDSSADDSAADGDSLGWKRIRPRTLKRGSTISDVERGSLGSSQGWPEERSRSETLCIDSSRIESKFRFIKQRMSNFQEEHNRLIQERSELKEKRDLLLEKMRQQENELTQESITEMQTKYEALLQCLSECNYAVKTKSEEMRMKSENDNIPPLEDILILSQLLKVVEPLLLCPPIEVYQNNLIEQEINSLKEFNSDLEKKIERNQARNQSKAVSEGISSLVTTLKEIKEPLETMTHSQIESLIESLDASGSQVIEKMTLSSSPTITSSSSSTSLNNSLSSSSSSSSLSITTKKKDPNEELYLVDISAIDNSNDTLDGTGIRFSEKKEGEEYPQIKAATVNKLVERLTYQKYPDMGFQKAFLLTYRSFMTPLDLMEKLTLRFCITPSGDASAQELDMFRKYIQTPVQLRVTNVLRNWIENHWPDFDDELKKLFLSFVENTVTTVNSKLASSLSQSFLKKDQNAASKTIQRVLKAPPSPILPSNLNSFTLDDLDAIELARQLTLLEHRLYKNIEPKELLHQAWSKKDKEKRSPNVLSMIRMFNKISNWVCSEIVGTTDLPSRASKLRKFIDIAKECYRINNFNGTLEIVAALGNSAVFRLKKTWEDEMVKSAIEDLEQMKQLMETNYKKFRDELHRANPPCIPYIGIFLTDLTFTEDGMPNTLEGHLINFAKLRQVGEKIQEIQQYQNDSYNYTEVPEIQKYLNDIQEADDDTLYKLSQKIESKKLNKFFG